MGKQLDGRSDLVRARHPRVRDDHRRAAVRVQDAGRDDHGAPEDDAAAAVAGGAGARDSAAPRPGHLEAAAKKRDDRYADTAELRVDLRASRAARPAAARRRPPVVVAPSQPTRNAPATDRVNPIAGAPVAGRAEGGGVSRGTILLVAGLIVAVAAAVVAILLFVVH